MTENVRLRAAMDQAGYTQAELVEALSKSLVAAGHRGTISDRTVRYWLTGKSEWPQRRQRDALEAVFGCPAVELGFIPPEGALLRRTFLASTTMAGASLPFMPRSTGRVGTSEVAGLRASLESLTSLDDKRGGHTELERAALAGAADCLNKQDRASSQRIRQRLLSLASDFTATAAWSSIDARQLDRADAQLKEALYLARMANDSATEMRVWNSLAMLAHQRKEHGQAVDAGYAAQATGITRRDRLFASLAHARTAVGHANRGDRQAALRSLGFAEDMMGKADPEMGRPPWIAFYGPAELYAMGAIVRHRLGDAAEAEAVSHRALAVLPDQFRRNRALATARLALAQLHQGDSEQACDTAAKVFDLMAGAPLPGRMRSLIGDFYRDLLTLAPDAAVARDWGDQYRDQWSR
ncbi:transcriptional regulator with XRE-family HTH domain [Streptomyces sp. V4I23]|uniref:helix-turn-helix domain-containing protein n=1 Tax=Streptomyces sp. V4I23 TaxID=3042282 RepID=UPI002788D1B9|nr:helix-turn-helix transcriptional regulator [Streptomyces sp. V4I23]MDQ1006660.1 transcriptional regulator with XRE-family HTH domain [Streptomyces sp. V4I23]